MGLYRNLSDHMFLFAGVSEGLAAAFMIDLQGFLNCLKRSPMPKLGDLLPKVPGKW